MKDLFRRQSPSERPDLTIRGTLADWGRQDFSLLPAPQRDGLLARFVAEVAHIDEARAAGSLHHILGLRLGVSRVWGQFRDGWRPDNALWRSQLGIALYGEVEAAVRALVLTTGLSPNDIAGAILTTERIALGRRTIGDAIKVAPYGDLEPLTPLAPIGPVRLWADSLM